MNFQNRIYSKRSLNYWNWKDERKKAVCYKHKFHYLHQGNILWAIELQDKIYKGWNYNFICETWNLIIWRTMREKVKKLDTVKLYDASTSPIFLVVTVATPNWVKASNVGILTFKIFPGLLKIDVETLSRIVTIKTWVLRDIIRIFRFIRNILCDPCAKKKNITFGKHIQYHWHLIQSQGLY